MITRTEVIGDVIVVGVKGKLMGTGDTDECHKRVKQFIAEGHIKAIVDLTQVEWVNSRGLGMLIACFTSCRNNGGDMKIVGASAKTKSLLQMTRLSTVFEMYDTVDQAIKSYR